MGAFYCCHIIGKGTEEDPYRPYIDIYPVNWVMAGEVGRGALVYVSNPTPELGLIIRFSLLTKTGTLLLPVTIGTLLPTG